jgi:predicted nuclease of predicted toxin-antitoxin system
LTLRLYLDDSVTGRRLTAELRLAAYEVVLPADVGLSRARDNLHFEYARAHGLVLVTLNPDDFIALHRRQPDHPGIIVIYRDNDRTRDMTDPEIVRAIGNLLAVGIPLRGQVHALNHWRY